VQHAGKYYIFIAFLNKKKKKLLNTLMHLLRVVLKYIPHIGSSC
jgi:hypothetical protein